MYRTYAARNECARKVGREVASLVTAAAAAEWEESVDAEGRPASGTGGNSGTGYPALAVALVRNTTYEYHAPVGHNMAEHIPQSVARIYLQLEKRQAPIEYQMGMP